MYKNFKRMATLFIAAATMFAVSCTKEENNTNNGNQGTDATFTAAKADITYKITLDAASAEALNRAYDAFLDYYDSDGTIKSSTEINANNLTWQKSVTPTSFPAEVGYRIRLVPKSNLDGVTEEDSFDCTGTLSLQGTCTSTTGKTREISRSLQIQKQGINPHSGRTFKEVLHYQIKTDGTSESNNTWEE